MCDTKVTRRKVEAVWHLLGWLWLALLSVPALADENLMERMDKQVTDIVRRVTPSVVSVRVGPRRSGQTGDLPSPFGHSTAWDLFLWPASSHGRWSASSTSTRPVAAADRIAGAGQAVR